jgi:trk system potassium uptake protein
MFDLRPVGYVIGLLVASLGLTMLGPLVADYASGSTHWPVFLESALITTLTGGLIAVACANSVGGGLTIRQGFLLTTGTWAVLPLFGALPFMLGATEMSLADAYFEAMSGVSTTGTTMITGLDDLPKGLLLWRGILQWLGGLGIVIVAMLFLPVMRVGGMQFFQSEGFDTLGKVLPRWLDIAGGLLNIYFAITGMAIVTFFLLGMSWFDAAVHGFTVVSTGGFSTRDASFGAFPGAPQYAAAVFMILGTLPFIRLLQVARGEVRPILVDGQVRAYLGATAVAVGLVVFYRMYALEDFSEQAFRETLFNVVSFFSGTGYATGDVTTWGTFSFVVLICVGAVGGCTGSTGCSIKIFRYQILFKSIISQTRQIHSPNRVVSVQMQGRKVDESVMDSVILLFTLYILTLGALVVALSLTGLSFLASITGAWTAIFNIGPVFGQEVGVTGSVAAFPVAAKWMMSLGMLMGRLEIIAVIVILLPRFWKT